MTNEVYSNIFLAVVTLLTLYVDFLYNGQRYLGKKHNARGVYLLAFLGTIFFTFRPLYEDSVAYARSFNILKDIPFSFTKNTDNIVFDNLMHWMAAAGFSVDSFFAVVAAIYLFCCVKACKKIFPEHALLAFVVFLGAFSTYSYAVNGIKAGAAASIFMCAIAYIEKLYIAIPLCLLSWGFHHSMHVCIYAFAVVYILRNPKYYLWLWFIFVFCSAIHFTFLQDIFAYLTDERGSDYFLMSVNDVAWEGKKGFRYDFVLYSMMPILLGWKVYIKDKIEDKLGVFIFNIYTLLNSIWLMCMYIAFTNRIAYFSWALYPLALLYPTLLVSQKNDSYRFTIKVVTLHLGFTLAMHFIYYA